MDELSGLVDVLILLARGNYLFVCLDILLLVLYSLVKNFNDVCQALEVLLNLCHPFFQSCVFVRVDKVFELESLVDVLLNLIDSTELATSLQALWAAKLYTGV